MGHHQAGWAGEVDLLLPLRDPRRVQPLRRRLDRRAPRERRGRQGPDRPGLRAAADRAGHADRARRPRQLDDQQAGRLPARRPRSWFTLHLLGQSLSSWSNGAAGALILRPFRWPLVTWIASSSPRWTLFNTVWR